MAVVDNGKCQCWMMVTIMKGSDFGKPSESVTKIKENVLSEGWLCKLRVKHCDPIVCFWMLEPCGCNINFVEWGNAYCVSNSNFCDGWNFISELVILHARNVRI